MSLHLSDILYEAVTPQRPPDPQESSRSPLLSPLSVCVSVCPFLLQTVQNQSTGLDTSLLRVVVPCQTACSARKGGVGGVGLTYCWTRP